MRAFLEARVDEFLVLLCAIGVGLVTVVMAVVFGCLAALLWIADRVFPEKA